MRDSARDAPHDLLEHQSCSGCGYELLTAGPFSKSGPLEGRATKLDAGANRDERGYTVCPSCCLVLDDGPRFEEPWERGMVDRALPGSTRTELSASAYNNHYDRLIRRHTSFDMRRADLLARFAVDRKTRQRVSALAGILYDTDALCSKLDIRGALKEDVLHAVEGFFTTVPPAERVPIRYEAFVMAIVEQTLKRRAPGLLSRIEGVPLWSTFVVSQTTRERASQRVESWFQTSYWK